MLPVLKIFFWCLMPLSAISWRPALVVEEAGVPGENHRPWASRWLDRDLYLDAEFTRGLQNGLRLVVK
jgi:hypothetical protein